MPLDYATAAPLDIPEDAYNQDGLAVLLAQGGRYGGDWVVNITRPGGNAALGRLDTILDKDRHPELLNDPRYPYLAVESVFIWLRDQTATQGLRLVSFGCMNHHYGPGDARFFCAAQVVVANARFEPQPGTKYADEWSLDQAMAARV